MRSTSEVPGAYRAHASTRSADDVFDHINRQVFIAHGPDERARGARGLVVDPPAEYERLLRRLLAIPGLSLSAFADNDLTREPEGVQCLIRHDIDLDIVGALQQAELERDLGVRSTWFVLHTAPYYGELVDGQFHRYESMAEHYRRFQDLGHEVAVHTDPLLIYQSWLMDGAVGLTEELHWLRSRGLDIVGTTAHNSVGVYNAANYAIFEGRPRALFEDPADRPDSAEKDGRVAPLGVLNEAALGLTYEANELFWQSHTPVTYAVLWSSNRWWWEDEKSNERIKALQRAGTYDGGEFIDTDELMDRVARLSGPRFLNLVLHPVYYGLRSGPGESPVQHALTHLEIGRNAEIGWYTYRPGSLVAVPPSGAVGRQTIWRANERGMLDRLPLEDADSTVLFLGGRNIDGRSVPVPTQLHCRIEDALPGVSCRKFAHPDMDIAQLFGWFGPASDEVQPDVVVLRVGCDDSDLSLAPTDGSVSVESQLVLDGGRVRPGLVAGRRRARTEVVESPSDSHVASLEELLRFWREHVAERRIELVVLYEDDRHGSTGWRAAYAALANELDVAFVDPYDALAATTDSVDADGLWTAIGHRVVAEALRPVIEHAVEKARV